MHQPKMAVVTDTKSLNYLAWRCIWEFDRQSRPGFPVVAACQQHGLRLQVQEDCSVWMLHHTEHCALQCGTRRDNCRLPADPDIDPMITGNSTQVTQYDTSDTLVVPFDRMTDAVLDRTIEALMFFLDR